MCTMLPGTHGKWQPMQKNVDLLFRNGEIGAENDTARSALTATSGQPGPVAIVHALGPAAEGTKRTSTTTESPGASVCGPPPETSVKSVQLATTFRRTGA